MSSDESTIISSQTSTLTRNQGPEDMRQDHFDGDEGASSLGDDEHVVSTQYYTTHSLIFFKSVPISLLDFNCLYNHLNNSLVLIFN